ncbi:MauE/DoxX family redox-associated membrane protein [Komagataeibacter europaeus]|uniref:MauE/DoxX family redox-associated membrane protein n=1 Tax=Komagataeibacter europaeus TaxID=33995 RepID=UPI000302E9FF|nr:MauE/DoxX family redox-associated membrane protein [Komagataeibacter europaeus]
MDMLVLQGACGLCCGLVGGMFLLAGLPKLADHDSFLGVIASYRLVPSSLVTVVAWAIALAETLAAAALLSGMATRPGGLLSLALIAVFTLAMGINVARGRTALSCGCMPGSDGEHLSWKLVARTALCALPALMPVWIALPQAAVLRVESIVGGVCLFMMWRATRVLAPTNTEGLSS